MPVTIRDVAKSLDLSVTTVSRALAGYSDVAELTRQRVVDATREMGYVPSRAARQLRRQRMETVGLVFPTNGARFSDPFFSEFIAGVGDELSTEDYDLLVSVASPGEVERATYERLVNSRRVDGFVLVRMRLQDWRIGYLSREGIPFVSFGRSLMEEKAPHVGVDGRAGIRELVGHLVKQGHRSIAFIAAPKDLTLAPDRLDGYKAGLGDAGIAFDPELVIEGSLTRSAGYEAAKELLKRVPPPTAIVGANDLSALGAMRAAQERGMAIGRELAIAGFDGIEASEHSHPALTTVYQPVYDIGRRVCSMLISIIEGEPYTDTETLIKPTLVIRQSTLNGKE